MTPPPWQNEQAVAAFVAAELEELRSEIDRLAWTRPWFVPTEPPDLVAMAALVTMENRMVVYLPDREREAIGAALRGDLEPLVDLIRPLHHPPEFHFPDAINPAVKHLSPDTWEIVAQFLTGERNLKTGRRRGEPGRPVQSVEQRRADNPVHRAADEFRVIFIILKRHFPNRSRNEIEYRGAKIAAERNGARHETLLRHLARSARDPRRIS
jgi:hypothetical protein